LVIPAATSSATRICAAVSPSVTAGRRSPIRPSSSRVRASQIPAFSGSKMASSFHHGTLVGAGGQPIHPLMFVVHTTLTPSGEMSSVTIDFSDCSVGP
jgi:hypothetical protein